MEEIELVVTDIDRKEIQNKLKKLGAEEIFEDEMLEYIFGHKRDFLTGKKLRIRKEGPNNLITLKIPKKSPHAKIRQEFEVEVSDFNKTVELLEAMDFIIKKRRIKHRTSYRLDGVRIEIDKYLEDLNFVPAYIEFEGKSVTDILLVAKKMGFEQNDCKPLTTSEIIQSHMGDE